MPAVHDTTFSSRGFLSVVVASPRVFRNTSSELNCVVRENRLCEAEFFVMCVVRVYFPFIAFSVLLFTEIGLYACIYILMC